ncbi:hypothetical protein DESUT3_21110 [Desulfuromonas versatilis]|uniref:DUF945 domain-containing protein n=1 Tax=Desulfuromonas versatilis TaxID=2802975 RepID=A0ABM8HT16_9BACT|nr:YdgA family protein [Desulfuromonas versatilis]BCR05042.1 hypothetical protein DESUT3_21110 [Desulfuromonas versatilis]
MKKLTIVILILAVLCAGWAGATYYIGGQAQERYENLLQQYAQLGPVTLSGKDYQRGLLSSEAETLVEFTLPSVEDQQEPTEPVTLVFRHTLRHGPLTLSPALAQVETRLVSVVPDSGEFARVLAKVPELAEPFAFVRVNLDGSMNSRIELPAFQEMTEEGHFTWGGFRFEMDSAPGMKTLVGSFDLPKVELQEADVDFTWDGFRGQFDLTETRPLLYVGTNKATFGSMEMSLPEHEGGPRKTVRMEGFEVVTESSSDGKLIRYVQSMQFAGLTVEGKTYGPGVCEVEVSNLDCDALAGFQGDAREVYRNADNFNPDELAAQVIPLYGRLVEKLVTGNPELNIRKLHFSTPMGDFDGNVQVKLAGGQGLTLDNPAALLEHLEAAARVSVAEGLIGAVMAAAVKDNLRAAIEQGQVPPYSDEEIAALAEQQLNGQLEALVAQNFILREGGQIKTSATFNRGELAVNGQPLPLFGGQ